MKKLITLFACFAMLLSFAFAEVVAVTDGDEFEDTLGIEFDDDDFIIAKPVMSVIDGKMGQVCFTLENVDGVELEWTLRFTREEGYAGSPEAFCDVQDDVLTEPAAIEVEYQEDADDAPIALTLTQIGAETLNYTMYFWDYADAHYSLCIPGLASQMQISAVLDNIFEATIDD